MTIRDLDMIATLARYAAAFVGAALAWATGWPKGRKGG